PAREPARHARVPRTPASRRARRDRRRTAGDRGRSRADRARSRTLPRDEERRDARPGGRRRSRGRVRTGPARPPGTARRLRAGEARVAAAPHRAALPRATAPPPGAAAPRAVQSVRRGCLPFSTVAFRGAVRGSRIVCPRRLIRLDREQALDVALGQIERQFGKGSVMKMSDHAAMDIGAISTGSLALDLALGIGGLPRGRIVEIFGPESSGKTTLVYHVIAEAQRRGGICAFIDAEHAMDPTYAKHIGVNIDDLLV